MKRIGHLWDQLVSFENLYLAYRKAIRGKRLRPDAARFIVNAEDELLRLQDELQRRIYQPCAYRTFYVYDRKPRLISAAPFRDRVVHHALCNVLEPIFEPTFIADLYSNRVGKGQHQAVRRAQEFARSFRYLLKCDIRRFSIPAIHKNRYVAISPATTFSRPSNGGAACQSAIRPRNFSPISICRRSIIL